MEKRNNLIPIPKGGAPPRKKGLAAIFRKAAPPSKLIEVANAMVEKAIDGDVAAAKFVFDRIFGPTNTVKIEEETLAKQTININQQFNFNGMKAEDLQKIIDAGERVTEAKIQNAIIKLEEFQGDEDEDF